MIVQNKLFIDLSQALSSSILLAAYLTFELSKLKLEKAWYHFYSSKLKVDPS